MHFPRYYLARRCNRAATPPADRAARRILLVEDSDSLRRLALRTLSAQGYVVAEARHGEDALRLVAEAAEAFDLVITERMMSVMSGDELGRCLAKGWPGLPVLYISAAPGEAPVRCGLPPGPPPLLRKPFPPDELVLKVAELLRPLI